jgi:two-component system, NtrC family, sensor histidine kinase HydH
MESENQPSAAPGPGLPEVVVRTLRHEVGDLLQTVYATAAILQERLPTDWALERRIVSDLRTRGQACTNLLDTVHDLVCTLHLNWEPVDLAEVAGNLVDAYGPRYPRLQLHAEALPVPAVLGDAKRLNQMGGLLLTYAGQAAAGQVRLRTQPGSAAGEVEWLLTSDAPGLSPDDLERVRNPFATTRHNLSLLSLALARRIALLHGGRMEAGNRPESDLRVQVILPAAPSAKR